MFRVGREEILAGNGLDFDCFLIAGRYTLLDQSALEEVLPLAEEEHFSYYWKSVQYRHPCGSRPRLDL